LDPLHYAWSLRDAVAAVAVPCIEVHLSDVSKPEAWRPVSVLADVRSALCAGRGLDSSLEALELLLEIAPGTERDAEGTVALLAERLAQGLSAPADVRRRESRIQSRPGTRSLAVYRVSSPASSMRSSARSIHRLAWRRSMERPSNSSASSAARISPARVSRRAVMLAISASSVA